MPIFKKRNGMDLRRVLEKKLHLARESRDEIFDLSECGLSELPTGVESQIKVFQKTVLLLHSNSLRKLCSRGRADDLSHLIHLDLHFNRFSEFPMEIFRMQSLQYLDVSYNKLESLPEELGSLKLLRILNVEGNYISILPSSLVNLSSLKELYLEKNPIKQLPECLGFLFSLEKLRIPLDSIVFPNRDVCEAGLAAVQSFLRKASGIPDIEFEEGPPLQNIPYHSENTLANPETDASIFAREQLEKSRCSQNVHQHLIETLKAEEELVNLATKSRMSTLDKLAKEGSRTEAEFSVLQAQRDSRRRALLASVRVAEEHADLLISKLTMNKEAVRSEEALWEQEQVDALMHESIASVGKLSSQRRRAILDSMQKTLLQSEKAVLKYRESREHNKRSLLSDQVDSDKVLKRILNDRKIDNSDLASQLSNEEAKQKEAFKRLQADKDLQSRRILHEIQLVQLELFHLTQAEQERRRNATNVNSSILAKQRRKLIDLLEKLQQEKNYRDDELQKRLIELEERKSREQADYWLIQYQRLLDKKPPSLLNKVFGDDDILRVLEAAGASEYAPHFLRHRITSDMLYSLTDSDLADIGVQSVGGRKAILRALEDYIAEMKLNYPQPSAPRLEDLAAPSAPPGEKWDQGGELKSTDDVITSIPEPSAPPAILARFESECCVCQDDACAVIFLSCGHVCCCNRCGSKVSLCPICRTIIVQRIELTRNLRELQ